MTATATIAETDLPTAEHIAALFREHDVLPWQTVYLAPPHDDETRQPKCTACALGILLVAHVGDAFKARDDYCLNPGTVFKELAEESGIPFAFLHGLDNGFTDSLGGEIPFDDGDIGDEPLYLEGYRVGWHAWELATVSSRPSVEPRT